jgi:Trypsin
MRVARWAAPAMLAVLFGCAPDASEHDARLRSRIIDGQLSGAGEDGVVLIRAVLPDISEVLCSASLVAPNLLITARHCVSYLKEGQFSCSTSGELINGGDGAGHLGIHFPAESIEVYGGPAPRAMPLAHGQQVISTLSETICLNDLAFVVLDTPLDLPVVPLRMGRSAEVGELATLVGFGLESDTGDIDFHTQARRHKVGLAIAAVGPDSIADGVTTVPPRTLLLKGPSGCLGDSGGPLLDDVSGALLGVYSLQSGEGCRSFQVLHFLVHVPPFELLIGQAFAAAGAEPLLEAKGGAGGEASGGEPSVLSGGAGGGGGEPSVLGDAGSGAAAGGAQQDPPIATHGTRHGSGGCALARATQRPSAPELLLALGVLAAAVQRSRRPRLGRRRLSARLTA